MDFLVTFVVVSMTLKDIQAQFLNEIILHLTPSQIKAFQEGQSLMDSPLAFQADSVPAFQAGMYPQVQASIQVSDTQQNVYRHPRKNNGKSPITQEPQTNPYVRLIELPNNRQSESKAHNVKRFLKPVPFYPDADKRLLVNEPKASPESEEPVQEIDYDEEVTRQKLKEQWLRILKQYVAHFKAMEALSQTQKESPENETSNPNLSQNDNRYKTLNNAKVVYNFIRDNNQQELEEQRVQIKAEAIANAPLVLVPDKVNMKHSPAQFNLQVPDQPSDWVPIQGSFDMKEPQAYENPLEVKTAPVLTGMIQSHEVVGPVPAIIEQHSLFFPASNVGHTRIEHRDMYSDGMSQTDHYSPMIQETNQGSWSTQTHNWN